LVRIALIHARDVTAESGSAIPAGAAARVVARTDARAFESAIEPAKDDRRRGVLEHRKRSGTKDARHVPIFGTERPTYPLPVFVPFPNSLRAES